jgi:uncharacterized phiE125 gp8 family phage protein
MTLRLIQGPAIEPVTLAEAKFAARVDGTEFDTLIPGLIATARRFAEQKIERSIIEQTWEQVLDDFPEAELELGWPTVRGIVSLSYIDTAGVTVNLDPSLYVLDAENMPGWVLPAAGTDWPATYDTINAVRVRFLAGYGQSTDSVPEEIKTYIKAHVALWLRQVEAASDKPMSPVPYLENLLDRERWSWA